MPLTLTFKLCYLCIFQISLRMSVCGVKRVQPIYGFLQTLILLLALFFQLTSWVSSVDPGIPKLKVHLQILPHVFARSSSSLAPYQSWSYRCQQTKWFLALWVFSLAVPLTFLSRPGSSLLMNRVDLVCVGIAGGGFHQRGLCEHPPEALTLKCRRFACWLCLLLFPRVARRRLVSKQSSGSLYSPQSS